MSLLFSRLLRDSTPRYVGPSVGRWVPFKLFFGVFELYEPTAPAHCPNALVTFSSTAPAHPHATGVVVYPALFTYNYRFFKVFDIEAAPLVGDRVRRFLLSKAHCHRHRR